MTKQDTLTLLQCQGIDIAAGVNLSYEWKSQSKTNNNVHGSKNKQVYKRLVWLIDRDRAVMMKQQSDSEVHLLLNLSTGLTLMNILNMFLWFSLSVTEKFLYFSRCCRTGSIVNLFWHNHLFGINFLTGFVSFILISLFQFIFLFKSKLKNKNNRAGCKVKIESCSKSSGALARSTFVSTERGGCTSMKKGPRSTPAITLINKKLSYRRETARQLPTSRGGGLDPPVHSPSSGYTYAYGRIRKPQRTYMYIPYTHWQRRRKCRVIPTRTLREAFVR